MLHSIHWLKLFLLEAGIIQGQKFLKRVCKEFVQLSSVGKNKFSTEFKKNKCSFFYLVFSCLNRVIICFQRGI